MIEIVLLGAPRGKERPRMSKGGIVYTPQKTRDYEGALKYAAAQVMGDRAPLEGPLRFEMEIVVPIAQSWSKKRRAAALAGQELPTKKPDGDNFLKMKDALNMVVFIDDAQIVHETVWKRYGDKPGMWIRVWPYSATPAQGVFA